MIDTTLTVFQKILEMFLMASVGFICGKRNLVTENGTKELNSILFYVVTPAVLVASFQDSIGKLSFGNLGSAFLASFPAMGLGVLLSFFCFRKESPEKQRVLRFAAAYPNAGFIGLPLAQAVFGSRGVLYAAVFVIAYNLFVWTHGTSIMQGTAKPNWKSALINPGIIGLIIGLPLFLFSISLPEVILSPVSGLSSLNTPLAMIVLGSYISRIPLKRTLRNSLLYRACAVRLLLAPAVFYFAAALLPFPADSTVFSTVLILASAPSAVNTVMFAVQYGADVELASGAVAVCTLLSLFTMPLFAALPPLHLF